MKTSKRLNKDCSINVRLKWINIFNKNNFKYCLLRDEKEVLYGNAIEVDILLHPDDLSRAKSVLLREGYVLRSKFSNYPHFPFYLYDENGIAFILDIVIKVRVGCNSTLWPLISTEQLLSRSVRKKNVPILCDQDEFSVTLLHEIIDKGTIREKWRHRLQSRPQHIDKYKEVLFELVNSKHIANTLVNFIAQKQFDEAIKLSNKIKLRLFCKNITKNLYFAIRMFISRIWENYWRKGPRVISIVGIDGSGKSTIVTLLGRQEIQGKKVVTCKLGHGSERRYYFLITAIICPVSESIRTESIAILYSTSGRYITKVILRLWGCIAKFKYIHKALTTILTPILFFLEDFIKLYKTSKNLSENNYLLTDRHLIDGVIHDVFLKGRPKKLHSFFYYHISRTPHLMVFINCSGELGYNRKKEIVADTGNKLNFAHKKWLIANYKKPQLWLDASLSIELLCNKLETILITLE